MQVRLRVHASQGLCHCRAHSHFIDISHVEDVDAGVVNTVLFTVVDAPYADLDDLACPKGWSFPAYANQVLGPVAAEDGDGHAMDVAAGGQRCCIEIRMGIEPQNAKFPVLFPAIAGDGAD